MAKFTEYLRLILFCITMLVGLQVPAFVDQYHKSLLAHASESELSLKEFQKDADRYFNGSLENLIKHYLASPDPVFNAGGRNVHKLHQRHAMLKRALSDFQLASYSPYYHAAIKPVPDIQQEVWGHFTHTVVLSPASILIGVVTGFTSLLFLGLWGLLLKAIRHLTGFTSRRSPKISH